MKFLLLGIDAAQKSVFQKYDMPFIHRLFSTEKDLNLKADLIGRGWVEIYSGKDVVESGGFYERPKANGTYEWSKDFSLNTGEFDSKSNMTIWDKLNSSGYTVGVMNVPTTSPAPKNVKGFFVSGGGGGKRISNEIDISQCSSDDVKKVLDEIGYVVDERIPSLLWEKKLYDPKDFFSRLRYMTEKRFESFILLSKKNQVDFGFLVLRSVAVIEYLARGEVDRYERGDGNINRQLVDEVYSYYSFLDGEIEKLFEVLSPEKSLIVSDHGLVPRKYSVNLNRFLSDHGFQVSSAKGGVFNFLKNSRHFIPYSLRSFLKKNSKLKKSYQSIIPFDTSKTIAFNITHMGAIYGIYVNDDLRFSGPILHENIKIVAKEILREFNKSEAAKEHGFSARIYEAAGNKFDGLMPDVIVDVPDGYYLSNDSKEFVSKYYHSSRRIELRKVKDDNWTGMKSKDSLSILVNGYEDSLVKYKGKKLKSVYDLVLSEIK